MGMGKIDLRERRHRRRNGLARERAAAVPGAGTRGLNKPLLLANLKRRGHRHPVPALPPRNTPQDQRGMTPGRKGTRSAQAEDDIFSDPQPRQQPRILENHRDTVWNFDHARACLVMIDIRQGPQQSGFPQPLRPRSATNSPRLISTSRFSSTVRSPNRRIRLRTVAAATLLIGRGSVARAKSCEQADAQERNQPQDSIDQQTNNDHIGLAVRARQADHVADAARRIDLLDHDQSRPGCRDRQTQSEQESGKAPGSTI